MNASHRNDERILSANFCRTLNQTILIPPPSRAAILLSTVGKPWYKTSLLFASRVRRIPPLRSQILCRIEPAVPFSSGGAARFREFERFSRKFAAIRLTEAQFINKTTCLSEMKIEHSGAPSRRAPADCRWVSQVRGTPFRDRSHRSGDGSEPSACTRTNSPPSQLLRHHLGCRPAPQMQGRRSIERGIEI